MMREKYLMGVFGHCPRIDCEKQNLLPIGTSNNLKISRVKVLFLKYKVYCPRCQDIFYPKKKCKEIDGAFYGTSFP
jgi:casein kinase II subunit beta